MSALAKFNWFSQAPFGCVLYRVLLNPNESSQFLAANAVYKVITGQSEQDLSASNLYDLTLKPLYFSKNTGLHYQVTSFAPEPGLQLVILQQMPDFLISNGRPAGQGASKITTALLALTQQYNTLALPELSAFMPHILAQLGQAVAADRVYIFDYDFKRQTCSNTFEWCAEGIIPELQNLQQVPLSLLPQWLNTHLKGQEMYLPDVPAMPEDDALKQVLQPQGIKSLLTLPIRTEQQLLGFVGFDSVRQHHYYTEQERLLLSVFAQVLQRFYQH